MGKIFLLVIIAAAIWGGSSLWSQWRSLGKAKEPPVSSEEKRPAKMPDPTPRQEPAIQTKPDRISPDSLAVGATIQDKGIHVIKWGMVCPGQELPCGAVLISWDESNLYAKQNGQPVVIRIKRPLEQMPDPVPMSWEGTNAIAQAGLEPPKTSLPSH